MARTELVSVQPTPVTLSFVAFLSGDGLVFSPLVAEFGQRSESCCSLGVRCLSGWLIGLLITGPTGTNVADVAFLLVGAE